QAAPLRACGLARWDRTRDEPHDADFHLLPQGPKGQAEGCGGLALAWTRMADHQPFFLGGSGLFARIGCLHEAGFLLISLVADLLHRASRDAARHAPAR